MNRVYRKIYINDIPEIVRIHLKALPHDFLPSLGEEFLWHLYHASFDSTNTFIFVCKEDGKVIGFVLGTINFNIFFKDVLRKKWKQFIITLLKQLLQKPSLIFNIFFTFFYSSKEQTKIKAELVIIAVDEFFQGKGIGTKLVEVLEQEFKKLNITNYKLTTLENYHQTRKFYQRLGFKKQNKFTLYKKNWILYTRHLNG